MTKYSVLHRCFFVFLAILGSICGIQNAQADETIVPGLTGTTTVNAFGNDSPWLPFSLSITGLQGQIDSTSIVFSFAGLPSNDSFFGQQVQHFPNYDVYTFQWSGTFIGGTVSIVAYSPDTGQVENESTGTITGGSFSGDETCLTDFPCSLSLHQTIGFTSIWTPGWRSDGTLLVDSVSYPPYSGGTLNMTTVVTPEPGSMMLVGLGIAAIASSIRRRSETGRSRCKSNARVPV